MSFEISNNPIFKQAKLRITILNTFKKTVIMQLKMDKSELIQPQLTSLSMLKADKYSKLIVLENEIMDGRF